LRRTGLPTSQILRITAMNHPLVDEPLAGESAAHSVI
jgi:hypothetical protein